MQPANPYQPPEAPGRDLSPRTSDGWVVCPQCGSDHVAMPTFTWWGGMAGQKFLNHVKCHACGHAYNGKTGESNTAKIIVYQVVAAIILGIFFFVVMR